MHEAKQARARKAGKPAAAPEHTVLRSHFRDSLSPSTPSRSTFSFNRPLS
ncbi:hypothetical protein [Nonomuraea sp. SYSU D8015]|nr:hypothetical protein [Nonomuraea sp. SYSU D8015]